MNDSTATYQAFNNSADSVQMAGSARSVIVKRTLVIHKQPVPGYHGHEVPYALSRDNFMIGLLLLCFLLLTVCISKVRHFMMEQAKTFLYIQRGLTTETSATSNEMRLQVVLIAINGLLMAIVFSLFLGEVEPHFLTYSKAPLIAIIALTIAVYYVAKYLLYTFVNWLFFDGKRNQQFLRAKSYLTATQTPLMLAIVLMQTFFSLSGTICVVLLALIVLFAKFLAFYKAGIIFFNQNGGVLKNILYFCSLEVAPIMLMLSILMYF